MTRKLVAALALLVPGFVAQPACVPAAHPSAAAPVPEVVQVAPPTGERETDRASILAALEQVQPGGTVQFAPGTYLVGELIRVAVPGITLLGHPEGTTLRGCEPDAYAASQADAARATDHAGRWAAESRCGLLELTGGHVTIRNFIFEQASKGLILGCCYAEGAFRPTDGGYLIENNTFRNSDNGIRPLLASPDTSVIRANRFINTFHAVSSAGSTIHVLDNDISVPQPARVPTGHPGFAIGVGPIVPLSGDVPEPTMSGCEHNLIAGNRIEGHETGIVVFGDPGTICRRNVIRDNTIIVRRVPLPRDRPAADWVDITDETDSTIVGVPLTLHNPTGEGVVEENVIERNRVIGADGIGIEVLHATRNRVVDNTITGVKRRDPFPGNTLGGDPERWRMANGSGIWISRGSEGNEISGNAFEDVASAAIVIEGDRNRVELRSATDAVRDLGSGNRVVGGPVAPATHEEVEALTGRFVRLLNDESWRLLAPFYAPAAVLALPEGGVLQGREAILDYFRPVVARIRGVEATSSRTEEDERGVTVTTTYTARFAPVPDPVPATFSNTWARQPDGSWLIVAGTFEPPGDPKVESHGTIRSGYFHSEGVRLHFLDFGGEGVPVLFISSGDRTAYAFMEFAPRFTDRTRVLALSQRGAGPSEGEPAPVVDPTVLGRDVVTLLDALGIERAVVAHMWQEVLVYLVEEHPERLAGLVFLGGGVPEADWRGEDPIGLFRMLERSRAAIWGADRDASHTWGYAPRYLETGGSIRVPSLLFVDETRTAEDEWEEIMEYARLAGQSEARALFPDSLASEFFERLATDEEMQERGRVFWRDTVEPVQRAAEEAFHRAFGGVLRTVPVEGRAIGYGYRDAPDLIYPHIRQFLDEVRGGNTVEETGIKRTHAAGRGLGGPTPPRPHSRVRCLNALGRASTASAAPVHTEVVSQHRSDLIPKLGCETPEPLRMSGLDGGDLGRADHGGNGQSGCSIAVGQRDVAGPAPVGGARDHDDPQEGLAVAEAALRDDERRPVLPRLAIRVGEGDANDIPLPRDRHSRRDPPRCPIR